VANVSSENLTLAIFCSGLKNKDLIKIMIQIMISKAKHTHRERMFLIFLLIFISGIDIPDLFIIFLNDCLCFLREKGL
jgi:hypothetical protein